MPSNRALSADECRHCCRVSPGVGEFPGWNPGWRALHYRLLSVFELSEAHSSSVVYLFAYACWGTSAALSAGAVPRQRHRFCARRPGQHNVSASTEMSSQKDTELVRPSQRERRHPSPLVTRPSRRRRSPCKRHAYPVLVDESSPAAVRGAGDDRSDAGVECYVVRSSLTGGPAHRDVDVRVALNR